MISEKDYCSKVCKAKCCRPQVAQQDLTCPNLTEENLCAIYERRFIHDEEFRWGGFVQIGRKSLFVSYHCGQIRDILKRGELRKEIEAQCCIAHPELLEADYGKELGEAGAVKD